MSQANSPHQTGSKPLLTTEDFRLFIDAFESAIDSIQGVTFLRYGSTVNGTINPKTSDIDGILIFEDEYILDKQKLSQVGKILVDITQNQLNGKLIPLQINVFDRTGFEQGTFVSYAPTFKSVFLEGDVSDNIRSLIETSDLHDHKHSDISAISFTFAKQKQNVLMLEYYHTFDRDKFHDVVSSNISAAVRNMLSAYNYFCQQDNDGHRETDKIVAIEWLAEKGAPVDVSFLKNLKEQLGHGYFDQLSLEDTRHILAQSLTQVEQLIQWMSICQKGTTSYRVRQILIPES